MRGTEENWPPRHWGEEVLNQAWSGLKPSGTTASSPLQSWTAFFPVEAAWHGSQLADSPWAVFQSSTQPRGILQVTSAHLRSSGIS